MDRILKNDRFLTNIFSEVAKIRNRRVVVGNTLNVLSRDHVNCEPPDLDVKCGENEQCGKWSCQMLRDKLTCDVTCDTGCKYYYKLFYMTHIT